MVVHDFDIVCITVVPIEAYSPLIVDADAVHVSPITSQLLQAVSGRNSQIVDVFCVVDDHQLSLRLALDMSCELPDGPAFCYVASVPVFIGLDQLIVIVSHTNSV